MTLPNGGVVRKSWIRKLPNEIDEATLEIDSSPVLSSISDFFKDDHPPALDLKENEESKSLAL